MIYPKDYFQESHCFILLLFFYFHMNDLSERYFLVVNGKGKLEKEKEVLPFQREREKLSLFKFHMLLQD